MSLLICLFRYTAIDAFIIGAAVAMMSVSGLFYIIGGQYLMAKVWNWLPISGYSPHNEFWKFLLLPVIIGVVGGLGSGLRWYRTLFLEEIEKTRIIARWSQNLYKCIFSLM